MTKITFRYLKFVFFSLIILEALLQLSAFLNKNSELLRDYCIRSLQKIEQNSDKNKTIIYFVGDSTVFGIGSSKPEIYSMPKQLEGLIQKINPDIQIINLGYPSTCTEEHLQLLSMLPEKSTVFYRGGNNDASNQGGQYKYHIGSYEFEFRTIKMLYLLLNNLLPITKSLERVSRIQQIFHKIMQNKKHNIYAIGYNSKHHAPPFYSPPEKYKYFDLFSKLKQYKLTDGNFMRTEFSSGVHCNDIGYYIEALLVYNNFCEMALWGLKPENIKTIKLPEKIINETTEKYIMLKKLLKNMEPFQIQTRAKEAVFELFQAINNSIPLNAENNERLKMEYLLLRKIGILIFHDRAIMQHTFDQMQTKFSVPGHYEQDSLNSFLNCFAVKIFFDGYDTHSHQAQNLYDMLNKNHSHHLPNKKNFFHPSPKPLLPAFPMEFCPLFIEKNKLNTQNLSTREAWEYFFSVPYDFFQQIEPVECMNK